MSKGAHRAAEIHPAGEAAERRGTASRKAFDVAETQLRGGTVTSSRSADPQTLFTAENTLVQVRLSKLLAASSLSRR